MVSGTVGTTSEWLFFATSHHLCTELNDALTVWAKSKKGAGDEKQRWEEALSDKAEKATVNTKFSCKVQSRIDSTICRL